MDYLGESFEKVREQMLDWKKLAVETKKWCQVVSALTELAKLEDSRGRDSSETRREIEAVKEERELDDEGLTSSQGSSSDHFPYRGRNDGFDLLSWCRKFLPAFP